MRYKPDRARCSLRRYAQTDPPLDPCPLEPTFPSILENLAGPGRARGVPGRESAPGLTRKGPNWPGSSRPSRVEASRVESSLADWLTDSQVCPVPTPISVSVPGQRQCHCQCQSEHDIRNNPARQHTSASPGRIAGLSNQIPRRKTSRHAARNWLFTSVDMGCEI